jgi:CarD family transcriptional regulator
MFKAGDPIIHPIRGAGVVVQVEEKRWHGSNGLYYRIELLGQPGTSLMIPIQRADSIGLRSAVSQSKLVQVWRVLRSTPSLLPSDHKTRYALLKEKLHTGDVLQVTEAVRDLAWRRNHQGNLTIQGKRIFEEGMRILSGEVAAARGVGMSELWSRNVLRVLPGGC